MANMVCSTCGYMGNPKSITKGSIGVELVLWLCFIFPGLIYSVWRLSTRSHKGCPKCGNASMIPADSPVGRSLTANAAPENL